MNADLLKNMKIEPFMFIRPDADGGDLCCLQCGLASVTLTHAGLLVREGYEERARLELLGPASSLWEPHWETEGARRDVRGDSLMLQFFCAIGHTTIVEFGDHKGLTMRVRMQPRPDSASEAALDSDSSSDQE